MKRIVVKESPLNPGRKVFIRTPAYHYVGFVLRVSRDEVLLGDCSWVAESGTPIGRLLASGEWSESSETEYVPGVVSVNRHLIGDVFEWKHDLPTASR